MADTTIFDQEEVPKAVEELNEDTEMAGVEEQVGKTDHDPLLTPLPTFQFATMSPADLDDFERGYQFAAQRREDIKLSLPCSPPWLLGYISGLHVRLSDIERLFVGTK